MEAANVLDIRDSVVFRGDFSRCTRWFRSVPLRLRKNTRQRPPTTFRISVNEGCYRDKTVVLVKHPCVSPGA